MTFKLTPNPAALKKIRIARQISAASLAASIDEDVSFINEIENSEKKISKGKAFKLATTLSVPVQYLFFKDIKIASNIPDFRTPENRPAVLSPQALSRIELAKSIINFLDDDVFSKQLRYIPKKPVDKSKSDFVTNELKKFYSPKYDRNGYVDSAETFKNVRVNIERSGVVIICESIKSDAFRGFCFSQKGRVPLIFINTANQRPATKLFTLMHECVHLILQNTGISDPNILSNNVETFCNTLVANLMMPEKEFKAAFASTKRGTPRVAATYLARIFGVSKQAAALRVSKLGLDNGFYSSWLASLPKGIPPLNEEDEADTGAGGGGISSQLGRFGYYLPATLNAAIGNRKISPFDAFRITHLSPDTVRKVAEMGSSRLGAL